MAKEPAKKKSAQKKAASSGAEPVKKRAAARKVSRPSASAPGAEPQGKVPRARSKRPAEKPAAAQTRAKAAVAKAPKARVRKKADIPAPLELPIELAAHVEGSIGNAAGESLEDTLEKAPEPPSLGDLEKNVSRVEGTVPKRDTRIIQFSEPADESGALASEKRLLSAEDRPVAGEDSSAPHESEPPPRLERLQKILSQAGVASRRRAEEMIVAGRVMVNGQVVTQLGAKADPARDHIRADGKLLQGAERHRYFALNKPRGFVTTVSDPEGRPTVVQFFSKMRERLYPVGRLDYDSEGLLLVTNDGELANQLTRAASGVEKTYWVKVAGRLTEEELVRLRSGVLIERGQPGSQRLPSAPVRIREVRYGGKTRPQQAGAPPRAENPWFEVVLIEGRNRELRKMFQAVGHYVEKIRRVGYGPLVLDLEPGQFRELRAEELSALRLAAAGKGPYGPSQADARSRGGKPRREWFPERRETKERPKEKKNRFGSPGPARFGERSSSGRSQARPEREWPGGRAYRFGSTPGAQRQFRDRADSDRTHRFREERGEMRGRRQRWNQDAGAFPRSGDTQSGSRREKPQRGPWQQPPSRSGWRPAGVEERPREEPRDRSNRQSAPVSGRDFGRRPGKSQPVPPEGFTNRPGKRFGSGARPGGSRPDWSKAGRNRSGPRDRR